MIIKVDIDSDLFSKIEKLVNNGKYQDIYQFVKIALNNQILEENSLDETKRKIPSTQSLRNIIEKKTMDIARLLSDIPLDKTEIPSMPSTLIWSFYNRFFPIKLTLRHILYSLSPEKKWLELSDIQEEAFSYAESVSESLKNYEEENNLPRNKKLSTGLPSPKSELSGLRGTKRKKKESKLHASKIRFQEQFVGKISKKIDHYTFSGACFEMGLIRVKMDGDSCLISLTENGSKFAIMENPILDSEDHAHAFYKEEVQFILDKIISRFELENKIVDIILKEIKNKDLTSKEIEKIFFNEKMKFYKDTIKSKDDEERLLKEVPQQRVSTMGRLSELRLVNWQIDNEGRSVYSYPYDK